MRIDRIGRWVSDRSPDNPAHVEDAARGPELDQGEAGLSVFQAEDETEQICQKNPQLQASLRGSWADRLAKLFNTRPPNE